MSSIRLCEAANVRLLCDVTCRFHYSTRLCASVLVDMSLQCWAAKDLLLCMSDFRGMYTVKNCCTIYRNLPAILVASKNVNVQKFCKSIITIVLYKYSNLLHAVKLL